MINYIRHAILFAVLCAGVWGLSTLLSLDFTTLLAATALAIAVRDDT